MKILLDECLPLDFRHSFPNHDCHTTEFAGFKGKSNGDLLRVVEAAGYEVLLTVDQGIPYEQNRKRKLAIIVLRARTNQIEDLAPLVGSVLDALDAIQPGEIIAIPPT